MTPILFNMRTQTLRTIVLAIVITLPFLASAQNESVFIQAPAAGHIAIEAENFSTYFDHNPVDQDLQSWITVNDIDASRGKALVASGGSNGNNGRGENGAKDAKANFYLQFGSAGTYYLYIRYKNSTGGNTLYISDGFGQAVRSYDQNLPNSSPAGQYRWQKISLLARGDFPGDFVVEPEDLGKVLSLTFWPQEPDFRLDRFVLSTDNALTDAQLDGLPNTANLRPSYRKNLLQYTSFEGLNQELGILSSSNTTLIGYPGNIDGEFFPYLGQRALYMNTIPGDLSPQVTFRPVRLACYQQSEVCFRWFSPAALDDQFEASDRFRASLIFLDDSDNVITSYPILDVPGAGIQPINSLGDGYLEYCYTIHNNDIGLPLPDDGAASNPVQATKVSLQFSLTASEDNEDIFIDEVYFTTTDPNPVTAAIDKLSIAADNLSLTVNAEGSEGGFLYLYAFSDGALATPQRDPAMDMIHTFAQPGSYAVSLYVLDECGNIREIDFRTVSALLPVEWLYFSARAKGNDVQLDWGTSTESNNEGFEIEWSYDGQSFKSIGQQKGAGTTQVEQDYTYLHRKPGSGIHYYRIKQIDFDGSFAYSATRSVSLSSKEQVQFFPNPVKDKLEFIKEMEEPLQVKLFDTYGREVKRFQLTKNRANFYLGDLAPGLYFAKYQIAGEEKIQRIIKG